MGPAHENDGTFNLDRGLKTSMATCGYEDIRDFQRAEVMVAPRPCRRRASSCSARSRWEWAQAARSGRPTGSRTATERRPPSTTRVTAADG